MTGSWSAGSSRTRRRPEASSFPIPPRRSPWKARCLRSELGARGEDGKLHPLDVKAGDRILFGKWSGTEIKIEGEELMIMKESDILGIIEGGSKRKSA